jgi:hypothetical protein
MRAAFAVMLLVTACGSSVGATGSIAPTSRASSATPCEPTSYRDATGVVTANGVFGVLGDTSTFSAIAMNEPLVILHQGAKEQDVIALHFNDIGNSSPATAVSYGVGARARPNPWGAFVFEAGWKPIGFAGSCWRVIANGEDTGLVLFVRP